MNRQPFNKYSFIIPIMNEEEVLPVLLVELDKLLEKTDGNSEVILIDDGSQDGSATIIVEKIRQDQRYKLIRLSRNFGHQVAVTAGLDVANGQATIIMDADLQDPPDVALELIEKWQEGYEIVYAQRNRREGETWFKKTSAKLFYKLLSRLSSVEIPQDVGDFRLVDKKVVDAIKSMPERDRFLRGMFAWVGYKQTFVKFDRPERTLGTTKYPLKKMIRLAVDGVVGFSDVPLRLAFWLGAVVSISAMLYGIYIACLAIFTDELIQGWASTIVVLSLLSGVNLLISGIIGLYVGRIHTEAKSRPLYLISEQIGFVDENVDLYDR